MVCIVIRTRRRPGPRVLLLLHCIWIWPIKVFSCHRVVLVRWELCQNFGCIFRLWLSMSTVINIARLEQIVALWDVLKCVVKSMWLSNVLVLRWVNTSCRSDSMRFGKLSVYRSNDVTLRNDYALSSHWGGFVACRSGLHDFLDSWGQVYERTCYICFVSVDL